ncbi:MAG: hypothetical protein LC121_02455 [Anaerolineae bacterium]|nr:hypothetical protein [Anaerolineae bacterium]
MSDWTTPKTWTVDELITAPMLNTHVRDNLGYLFARPAAQSAQAGAAGYTITGTSYAAVDPANLTLTLATASGRVMIGLLASLSGNATLSAGLRVSVDGGAQYVVWSDAIHVLVSISPAPLPPLLVTGLSAGQHTLALEAKASANTLTIHRSAAQPLRFWVMEV